jgi:hypothetical protein
MRFSVSLMVWMAPQISQIWVRKHYLLLLDDGQQVVAHQVDLLPPLPQPLHLLQTPRGVINLSLRTEDLGLIHHLLNILINGKDAVEYLPGAFGGETSLGLNGILVLLGLLLSLLEAAFDPGWMGREVQMHSRMYWRSCSPRRGSLSNMFLR